MLKRFGFCIILRMSGNEISSSVFNIIRDIRKNGDKAVFKYLKMFDGIDLSKEGYKVTQKTISDAAKNVSPELKRVIKSSYKNILAFHKRENLQIKKSWKISGKGLITGQFYNPVESAGVYVPGGRFSYSSSVLMSVLPAIAAGVKRVIMATPPKKMSNEVLFAAQLCGVKEIYSIGGASAIAAMAYGTEKLKKVDIIVGPGNAYVNEAKRQVFGQAGIDSLAGPSEVAIVADKGVPVDYAVNDIMAQVEHDPMAKAYLFCENKEKIEKIKKALPKEAFKQLKIEVCTLEKAMEKVNGIAPEHLELLVKNPGVLVKKVKNAGAVFAGYQTPTASGDYWAGPSHVLPTAGSAKFAGGLSVMSFLKRTSYIEMNKNNKKAYKEIMDFASAEGLEFHKKSAEIRSKS